MSSFLCFNVGIIRPQQEEKMRPAGATRVGQADNLTGKGMSEVQLWPSTNLTYVYKWGYKML